MRRDVLPVDRLNAEAPRDRPTFQIRRAHQRSYPQEIVLNLVVKLQIVKVQVVALKNVKLQIVKLQIAKLQTVKLQIVKVQARK